jgi:hypothetical protein
VNRLLVIASLLALLLSSAAPALQTAGIPLTTLGAEPFEALQGPYDQVHLQFQVPGHWRLQQGSSLTLSLQSFFSSFVPAQAEASQEELVAGNISVLIDGNLVQRDVLSQNGELLLTIPLSPSLFTAPGPEHDLTIEWDASASCDLNLSSTVIVNPESALLLEHIEGTYTPDLNTLPYPFFTTNALAQQGTLIIVPDNPSEDQLAAALIATAGLSRNSTDEIEIITEPQLAPSERGTHNLIFVGPTASFTSLAPLNLPHESSGRSAQPIFGFAEVVVSPWNDALALMVISGGSDAATINAARHAGSGTLLVNNAGNFASIEGDAQILPPQDAQLASFAQLGTSDINFEQYGRTEVSIPFYVDPDRAISQQAYIDLRFAHSRLIDYLRSGLTVSLNGTPLSSARLSDQTAGRHSEVVLLSPTLLRGGWNELNITADLLPLDLCASDQENQHWMTIFGDSAVNLPTAEAVPPSNDRATLGDLSPFFASGLQGSTLVLPSGRPAAWSTAASLLRELARETWPLQPKVSFNQVLPTDEENNRSLVLFGWFEDFAALPGISASFSADPVAGAVTLSTGQQIPYPADISIGMLQTSQLADGRPALAVWGNSARGLLNAATLLANENFEQQNSHASLVVLQDQTVLRDEGIAVSSEEELEAEEALQAPEASTGKGAYLYWILILLIFAAGLVVWEQSYPYIRKRLARFRR